MRRKGILKHFDFLCIDIVTLVLSYFVSGSLRNLVYQFGNKSYRTLAAIEVLVFFAAVYFYGIYFCYFPHEGYSEGVPVSRGGAQDYRLL